MMQTSGLCFADTNVWLYAFIRGQSPEKTPLAQAIISNPGIIISVQVISEICVNLLRKAAFSEMQLRELINSFFQKHPVVSVNQEVLLSASSLRERYSFSHWDSLMVAAALQTGAGIFYSEDMHDGLLVEEKLRIVNPFATKKVL